ncbi:AsmA-like C-terminal region-containing protein [Arenibacter troitsensis]|uniref:AsmA-like C-terminal region n=1 Tax=Arenibacter troitsensis TaxID=188872 RepID=A0A1X7HZ27_9FLAO|nr:AsmA-like C-terminal region-containing protein [Arenibacter troitsensis]SMG07268.1 AsmA-like C-terminal region [Arenibacter troitsensis]
MKKKILKIVGGLFLVMILLLVAAPFFLKGKIADIIKNKVNNSINATFDFSDADLSLFRSFPNATVTLDNITLINKAPFEGDTLFASERVSLDMSIKELFKDASEPIAIKSLVLDRPLINIKVDQEENANYDIAIDDSSSPDTAAETASSESSFTLSMESYAINNAVIKYDDLASGMSFAISEMNHSGRGDLSLENSELDTETSGLVSFEMDSTQYLNKNPVQLKALIGVDLKENKYSFLKNEAMVNQLALVFDGFVKLNEDNQEVNISFKTPSSDFKNFLAVIPEAYSKDIAQVTTTGNFTVAGVFKGIVDEDHIPQFKIDINSDNASFKYPDLPKTVRNVFIDTEISNNTGITEDTFVDIRKLSFMIDEDKFNMVAKINDLMGNTKVDAKIDGKMNLANISKAYPVPADLNLKGILIADIATAFDMASIENKEYENTRTTGNLKLSDFEYKSEEFPNPIILKSTSVTFNPTTVTLNNLQGATGKTDFDASGTIVNLLGFMFNNESIEGNFNLRSNTFAVNDFMVAETTEVGAGEDKGASTTSAEEKIKIPSFLDCTINATANTVIYDNLTLKDVKGTLVIRDEKAILYKMTSSIFDGKLALNGEVSTKAATPTFAMKLGMDGFKIAETFNALEMFRTLAPIAKILQGTLNSDIQVSGSLKDDFTPNLNTISGNILAELLTDKIDAESAPLLTELDSKLNFLDLDKLNLKDLKTVLNFEDGVVKVKPFTLKYQDFAINVAGSHTFDQKLNYAATIEVPAKYLGKDINNIIARIDEKSLENLTIPITANIGGGYTSPTVTTDLTSGIKNLTAQLVEIEKQKLINKGKDKAKNFIGDLIAKNQKATDSAKKENQVKTQDVIGGLLGAATKKTDSTTKTDTATTAKKESQKEVAKKILGGLLGKKKETSETKKDSVQ